MPSIQRVRWQNFRSFTDTGWVDLPSLTIIVGANASGKTSLIAPLLLLKQTVESRDASLSLKTKGRYFNAGSYSDLIFAHDDARNLTLHVSWQDLAVLPDPAPTRGVAPPATLELEYDNGENGDAPSLLCWSVSDIYGRPILHRRRNEDGSYSVGGLKLPDDSPDWNDAILDAQPEGFLFSPETVFAAEFQRAKEALPPPNTPLQVTLKPAHQIYLTVTGFVASQARDALEGITYLGPLRDKPRRVYELGGEVPFSVGAGGQFAPELIYRAERELRDSVNEWIHRFGFGKRLSCERFSDDVFSLMLNRAKGSTKVNVADTGFGLSQILPLIVQGYVSPPGATLLAEQPEIHLNPKLQSVLGDLLVDIALRGVKVVLETHSEHLILRIRRLIAEKRISAAQIGLYYVERDMNESTARRIPLDDVGHIESSEWPKGFFEDGLSEALALAGAQSKAVQRGK